MNFILNDSEVNLTIDTRALNFTLNDGVVNFKLNAISVDSCFRILENGGRRLLEDGFSRLLEQCGGVGSVGSGFDYSLDFTL